MKLAIVGLSGLLLLTGCGSSLSVEEQAKLIEYEKCLVYQQDNLNTFNQKMAQEESFPSLSEILQRQKDQNENRLIFPFEYHLVNCSYYRP